MKYGRVSHNQKYRVEFGELLTTKRSANFLNISAVSKDAASESSNVWIVMDSFEKEGCDSDEASEAWIASWIGVLCEAGQMSRMSELNFKVN